MGLKSERGSRGRKLIPTQKGTVCKYDTDTALFQKLARTLQSIFDKPQHRINCDQQHHHNLQSTGTRTVVHSSIPMQYSGVFVRTYL